MRRARGRAGTSAWTRIALDADLVGRRRREWLAGADELAARLIATVPVEAGPAPDVGPHASTIPASPTGAGATTHRSTRRSPTVHRALERRYRRRLHGPALNYYRDGRDSVAWHADRELRVLDDTIIAIVTLGTRRPFLLRPKGGGPSVDVAPGLRRRARDGRRRAARAGSTRCPKTARAGPAGLGLVPLVDGRR